LLLQAARRPVHRTAFTRGAADGSLLFNPLDFTLKNVANTGVLNWGGRLLALYEVWMLLVILRGLLAAAGVAWVVSGVEV
jgi:carotenoid cleavage dioxygenase-like enzyme